ncbi:MAG: hypothetical protein UY94_C0035G0003 [Parcubacteria group bacterium GW2011_GWA2_56_21]|nr:MAG: hypothetical protein UY94_C0035G0003 [Parcubacteria group bacterium GW2011_GWA2_56_21]
MVGNVTPVTVTKSEATKGAYPLPAGEPGQQRVIVKAYDRAGNTATESKLLTIAAINSPVITAYDKYLKAGDPFSVSGTTFPEARVRVTIQDASNIGETESTAADASGNFSLVWTKSFDAGAYSFTAVAENDDGAISQPTEPLTFKVTSTPLSGWGSIALRRRLKHIAVRSGRGVQYDFEHIMDDLHSLAVLLHKTKQKRELTREEDVILEKLKQHLKKMEDDILSRLEQIDDEAGT